MIIDFRTRPPYKTHMNTIIFNKPPLPEDRSKWGVFDLDKDPIPSKEQRSMELFMQEMDETDTGLAVIMGRKAEDNGDVDNDEIYELSQMYPGRFVCFAGIDPHMPGQIEEIERIHRLGFRGIATDAGWLRKPLYHDDPVYDPIYARCQELGLIVSITSSCYLGPDQSYSHPDAIQRVAMKYKKLRIVVPHGCWPHVPNAIAMAIRCPNVYLMPDCYVYMHGFPLSEEYVNAANSFLKYRTLYASSYPVRSLEQSLRGWKTRNFTPEALKLNLHDNARRLLDE